MPAKNALKIYLENGYYHIYNRGVEKRLIFEDEQDYTVFLSYLKTYLLPKEKEKLLKFLTNSETSYREKEKTLQLLRMNNFADEIKLLAYCLMPNHFHLLLKQNSQMTIDSFMRSLGTRYTSYFNKKYNRVGSLCQSVYKGVLIESEAQLLYLTSYIHRNPLPEKLLPKEQLLNKLYSQPSSLPDYLNQQKSSWVHPEEILSFFSKTNPNLSYQSFVEQSNDIFQISELLIDL